MPKVADLQAFSAFRVCICRKLRHPPRSHLDTNNRNSEGGVTFTWGFTPPRDFYPYYTVYTSESILNKAVHSFLYFISFFHSFNNTIQYQKQWTFIYICGMLFIIILGVSLYMDNTQNFPFISCISPKWQIADYNHQSPFGLTPNF